MQRASLPSSSALHSGQEKMSFQTWVGYEAHVVHAKDFDSLPVGDGK